MAFELELEDTSNIVLINVSKTISIEELKTMPWAAVWDYYCAQQNVPTGMSWFDEVKQYEKDVLSKR